MNTWIHADWDVPTHIHCGTTTRLAGDMAIYPHASFEISRIVDMTDAHGVTSAWPETAQPYWLTQSHGDVCCQIGPSSPQIPPPNADASTTLHADIVLAVRTADCLPIALFHPDTQRIALIHAGWRGLVNLLLEKTLCIFEGAPHCLQCWLGPCIQSGNYPIGLAWQQHWPKTFDPKHLYHALTMIDGVSHLSLQQLAISRLRHLGVRNITASPICTYQDETHCYSYRRDHGKTGRMATLLWRCSETSPQFAP